MNRLLKLLFIIFVFVLMIVGIINVRAEKLSIKNSLTNHSFYSINSTKDIFGNKIAFFSFKKDNKTNLTSKQDMMTKISVPQVLALNVNKQNLVNKNLQTSKKKQPLRLQKKSRTIKQNKNAPKPINKNLNKRQLQQDDQIFKAISQYQGSDSFGQCDSFSPQVIIKDIQDTKALGFGWARPIGDVFAQETVERQKGNYDFSTPDAAVRKLQAAGLRIFGTLFPTGMPRIPQSVDIKSFENYVKVVVDRYNGDGKNDMPGLATKITHWQVGIEPFCTTAGESCYKNFFDLVKTAYQAAKSVDASLMISPGGPAPIFDPNGNEDRMASGIFGYFFENGGANYMDFFNFHYLVGAKNHDIKRYIDYWRKYIPQNKEIWLSETGSRDVGDRHTISSNVQEEADWVRKHINDSFQGGIAKIFWCRAEHSYSDMPEVVKVLQEFAKQYGGNPICSVTKRQTQPISMQSNQQGVVMQGGNIQEGNMQQFGGTIPATGMVQQGGQSQMFGMPNFSQQQSGGMMSPGGMPMQGNQMQGGQTQGGQQQFGGMMQQSLGGFQQFGGSFQQPGGMMQQQVGSFQQPGNFQQFGGFSGGGYCGDNQCDLIEQQTGGCPQDCRQNSGTFKSGSFQQFSTMMQTDGKTQPVNTFQQIKNNLQQPESFSSDCIQELNRQNTSFQQ